MTFLKAFATTAALLSALIPNSVALNVDSKSNVAVYYGQGAYQPRLSHFCQETSLDIINIGFINVFPKAVGDWPGSNFGNQCDGNVYEGTELLSGCHQIWEDIPVCKELGKTIMLSLGGESAYESIPNDEVAEWFADFLWYSFGPPGQNSSFPRPFQDNQVDGFDFDIEHDGGNGYATMIQRLRSHYANFPDETFYISGAPQCLLPDAQLSDAISNSHFDFIWVQWYNTGGCSAMDFVEGNGLFNFVQWADAIKHSKNPNAKLFIGLPASEAAAVDGFYLDPAEVYPLVDIYMNLYPDTFGGIMLWEATASDNNQIDGYSFSQHMKHILHECDPSPPPTATSTIFVTPTSKPASSTPSSSIVHTSSQTPSSISTPSIQPSSSATQTASSTGSSSSAVSSSSSSAPQSNSPTASSQSVTGSSSTPVASHSVSSSAISSGSISTSHLSSSSALQSNSPTASSQSVTGSSSTPVASHSSTISSGSISTSHLSSSSVPASSDNSSTKPSATPIQTPSSSGSVISTHPGTSTSPASHSSSSSPGSSTHTPGTTKPSVTQPGASSTESFTTPAASESAKPSSSSSTSRVPPRTTITRTPVSSPPSATGTHSSSSIESSGHVTSSTVSVSVTSSTGSSQVSSSSTVPQESQSATGVESSSGAESTGAESTGAESTGAQSTGAQSTGAQSTGAQSTGGNGETGSGSSVTVSPSVTPIPSTTTPPTVTTIIVTSYTDICPTGFTTITTTITTTICPEATASVTNPASGAVSTTSTIPEGWTTTVKVCNNCAPTPTTVTLTLPAPAKTTEPALETSPAVVTEIWTTTVTFCKHCGVTGSSITLTIPHTPAPSTAAAEETPGASSEQVEATVPGELPVTTTTIISGVVPSHKPSSPWSPGSGAVHSPSQTPTFKVHASTTHTVQNPAPTGSGGGDVSPVFNAAGSRSSLMNLFGISAATLLSVFFLI